MTAGSPANVIPPPHRIIVQTPDKVSDRISDPANAKAIATNKDAAGPRAIVSRPMPILRQRAIVAAVAMVRRDNRTAKSRNGHRKMVAVMVLEASHFARDSRGPRPAQPARKN